MFDHLRRAERATRRTCRVLMDLAGPKLRTGPLEPGPAVIKFKPIRDALRWRVSRRESVAVSRGKRRVSLRRLRTPALEFSGKFLKRAPCWATICRSWMRAIPGAPWTSWRSAPMAAGRSRCARAMSSAVFVSRPDGPRGVHRPKPRLGPCHRPRLPSRCSRATCSS